MSAIEELIHRNEAEEEDMVVPVENVEVVPTSGSDVIVPLIVPVTVDKSLVSEHEEEVDDGAVEEEEDESEYEYEDEDDTAFGGFLEEPPQHQSKPARIEDDSGADQPAKKWREPSQQAVTMSLRAERETTGGKRRLASDLYKIMTADTKEAGFSLSPQSEDSMDKWTIKLFQFDEDSNLQKDLICCGMDHVELEMAFPDQYPFEPPFVRVVRPKFKKQSGFVMNGALCMELLTKDGWNPVNDIESVIVSIRSLLVVGDGRVQAAVDMSASERESRLASAAAQKSPVATKRERPREQEEQDGPPPKSSKVTTGSYSMAEAQAAYTHLSDYHKKKGWDNSGWWRKKG